jgi:cytochrome o ubiquinol oxidase operon protein cyoD
MERTKEFHHYLIGFGLATVLTAIPFLLVAFVGGGWTYGTIVLCAAAQLVVHLRFFLHLSFRGQQKEDLHLVLFTGLILLLMIGGTIWVLGSLYTRM